METTTKPTPTTQTTQTRFISAVLAIHREGIAFAINVRSCCPGCTNPEQYGRMRRDQPYGFSLCDREVYGGFEQHHELTWDPDGEPLHAYDETWTDYANDDDEEGWEEIETRTCPATRLVLYHGNGAGERIAKAFKEQGFTVAWDGTIRDRIRILFT